MKQTIKFEHDPMVARSVYITPEQYRQILDHEQVEDFILPTSEYNYQVLLRPGEVGISPDGRLRYIVGEPARKVQRQRVRVTAG